MEHILKYDRPEAILALTLRNASIKGDARVRPTIVPVPSMLEGRHRVAEPMRGEYLD